MKMISLVILTLFSSASFALDGDPAPGHTEFANLQLPDISTCPICAAYADSEDKVPGKVSKVGILPVGPAAETTDAAPAAAVDGTKRK
jgi:hypothetical protein